MQVTRKIPAQISDKDVNNQISSEKAQKMRKKPLQSQNSHKSFQNLLINKKKNLIDQLRTIDSQLRNYSEKQTKNRSKSKSKDEEMQEYNRASQLIAKMNAQRQYMKMKKKKEEEEMHRQIEESLKEVDRINQEVEKNRQVRRQKIKNRITNRKKQHEIQIQYNKIADERISQLSRYRESLPTINNHIIHPIIGEYQKKSLRKYSRSIFLDNIAKEQLSKKVAQINKNQQRYKIRERQRLFSQKLETINRRKQSK